MEADACIDNSPEHMTTNDSADDIDDGGEDGELIDIDDPKSPDLANMDVAQPDTGELSAGEIEESPESPIMDDQPMSPMDQQCPVLDERDSDSSMNARSLHNLDISNEAVSACSPNDGICSPDRICSPDDGICSSDDGICSPDEADDVNDQKRAVNYEDKSDNIESNDKNIKTSSNEPTSPVSKDLVSPERQQHDSIGNNVETPEGQDPTLKEENESNDRSKVTSSICKDPASPIRDPVSSQGLSSTGDDVMSESLDGHEAAMSPHSDPASPDGHEHETGGLSPTRERKFSTENLPGPGGDSTVEASAPCSPDAAEVQPSTENTISSLKATPESVSSSMGDHAVTGSVHSEYSDSGSEVAGDDIYSLDLTEGSYKSQPVCDSTAVGDRAENEKSDFIDSKDTGRDSNNSHLPDNEIHINSSSLDSPLPTPILSNSPVHSDTSIQRNDKILQSPVGNIDSVVRSSGDDDLPNGLDVKGDKVVSNTSFNEEHVELDYDEEEGDDVHGHDVKELQDGKHHSDSEDGKQDGELSTSDDDDKDDGELEDDEDCEEGEIREPGRRPFVKPICRFFMKANCTWGNNCRFLHPGINDKGNYRLFDPPNYNGGRLGPRARLGVATVGWASEHTPEVELPPPPPPPPPEQPASETAWERGLRHAKEMRKKATMRKEQETNFEEKRMNLSLDEERELNKENERLRSMKDPYYDQCDDDDDYYGKPPAPHNWEEGSYENFEVRWSREQEFSPFREKDRERNRFRAGNGNGNGSGRFSPQLDRIERLERQMYRFDEPNRRNDRREKFRDDRVGPPPPQSKPTHARADEWHDPWQRSKSPGKLKKRSSRSHSKGRRRRRSYSVSSHSSSSYSSSRSSSISSRSSRSSYSRSSSFSSRSPSPRPIGVKKAVQISPQKRQQQPPVNKPFPGKNVKNAPTFNERKVPFQSKTNDQPRSAVSVRPKPRSPEKRAGMMSGPPMKPGRPGLPPMPPPDERGRPRNKPPRAKHGRGNHRSSSGSSLSRSRSRSSSSSSFSRSGSSASSHSSSSSSSGSADSDHLYRDLPNQNKAGPPNKKKPFGKVPDKRGPPPEKAVSKQPGPPMGARRRSDHDRGDRGDRDRERERDRDRREERWHRTEGGRWSGGRGKAPPGGGRQPTTPVKPKDPLKLVGQKSNIKLTLLNKHAEKSGLIPGAPPKRRISDIPNAPPAKRPAIGQPGMADKPRPGARPEKAKSPPKEKPTPVNKVVMKAPMPGTKVTAKQPLVQPAVPRIIPPPPPALAKPKKSTSSRREELLKQLKAVEDAIARKKSKMQ